MQQELIYFSNIIFQARTQHCMSVGDLIKVLREVHGINLTTEQIEDMEANKGNYYWLIPTLAQIYNCDQDWLYTLYEQTPRP